MRICLDVSRQYLDSVLDGSRPTASIVLSALTDPSISMLKLGKNIHAHECVNKLFFFQLSNRNINLKKNAMF